MFEQKTHTVRVRRAALLNALRANLESHTKKLDEALAERRHEVIERLEMTLEKIKLDDTYQPREKLTFLMPDDHTAEYCRAIRMYEMSVDEEIELTENQFDQLVMDNWIWKADFLSKTSVYLGGKDK